MHHFSVYVWVSVEQFSHVLIIIKMNSHVRIAYESEKAVIKILLPFTDNSPGSLNSTEQDEDPRDTLMREFVQHARMNEPNNLFAVSCQFPTPVGNVTTIAPVVTIDDKFWLFRNHILAACHARNLGLTSEINGFFDRIQKEIDKK